jgi:hypothetical protein
MSVIINGTTGITTPDIDSTQSTLGPLTQALSLGSTGQIVFPSTQNASANANTLDDYEEGAWTPVIGGWTSITYNAQIGRYTKIGNQVTAWFSLSFSGTNAATVVTISGLPFSESGNTNGGAMTYYDAPMNDTTGVLALVSSTSISLYADNSSGSNISSNGNATNKFLIGSVTYQVV